jgi:pimeloyl-ACP methyl ester carboxylesterase
MKKVIFFLLISLQVSAQTQYPFPSNKITVAPDGKPVSMSYMDVNLSGTKSILLLHGKNFNGFYWKDVIPFLTGKGYRVIVPDQIGWGKSDRPDVHYSFHMLAYNTKQLLDTLGIRKVTVVGHSMGGMLAVRLTLMYPEFVDSLILENPIGLEDYRTFVPYEPITTQYEKELKANYESIKKYQQTYYPVWKPEYEQYVKAQADDLESGDRKRNAWVNARTVQMIYEQPVIYELHRITIPTLFIIGLLDRTVVGKDRLSETEKTKFGQYPTLGKRAANLIKGAKLSELEDVGHSPHIQDIERFTSILGRWLGKQ